MIVTGKSGGEDFKIVEVGTHVGVCDMIVGVGPQLIQYADSEQEKEQVYIRFEIPAERVEWEKDGKKHSGPQVIWLKCNATIGKKATLRKYLESWRGLPFTEEQMAGFDLNAILGKPCMISVAHNESKGKVYANINGISKLMKGIEPPKAENPLVSFDWQNHSAGDLAALPEWLQNKVKAGIALAAEQRARAETVELPAGVVDDFENTDIPF